MHWERVYPKVGFTWSVSSFVVTRYFCYNNVDWVLQGFNDLHRPLSTPFNNFGMNWNTDFTPDLLTQCQSYYS